jgi:S-adenosylmethionine-diacylgycerolhomoserine-N-methlytransferase
VDMGGGTGANLENARAALPALKRVYIVDLCKPLLEVAQRRIAANQWNNVTALEADATTFTPAEGHADLVTFSYSLTMIPDWHKAIAHAARILRPGGRIGVVDFYVSRKYPAAGRCKHGWCTRSFWPLWFAMDNVFLSPDHLPVLCDTFTPKNIVEEKAPVPYMPFRVPIYRYTGEKAAHSQRQ